MIQKSPHNSFLALIQAIVVVVSKLFLIGGLKIPS